MCKDLEEHPRAHCMALSVAPRLLWPRCCEKERVALPRKLAAVVKCGQLMPTLLMSQGGMFKFRIKGYESIQGLKYDQMISNDILEFQSLCMIVKCSPH